MMELEAEVDSLRAEISKLRSEAQEAVARTHRQYRRDLVPLRQLPDVLSGVRRR